MTPTRVEITVRLPDLESAEAQKTLSALHQDVRLNMPEANIALSKVTNTNDPFDSVKVIVEGVYAAAVLYKIVKELYGK